MRKVKINEDIACWGQCGLEIIDAISKIEENNDDCYYDFNEGCHVLDDDSYEEIACMVEDSYNFKLFDLTGYKDIIEIAPESYSPFQIYCRAQGGFVDYLIDNSDEYCSAEQYIRGTDGFTEDWDVDERGKKADCYIYITDSDYSEDIDGCWLSDVYPDMYDNDLYWED